MGLTKRQFFGVTNRFGSPDDLRFLIDTFHQANMAHPDWVPGPHSQKMIGRWHALTALHYMSMKPAFR